MIIELDVNGASLPLLYQYVREQCLYGPFITFLYTD